MPGAPFYQKHALSNVFFNHVVVDASFCSRENLRFPPPFIIWLQWAKEIFYRLQKRTAKADADTLVFMKLSPNNKWNIVFFKGEEGPHQVKLLSIHLHVHQMPPVGRVYSLGSVSSYWLLDFLCSPRWCIIRKDNRELVKSQEWEEEALSLHKAPDAGTGEGVFVQHVSVSGAPPGDQPEYQPDRQTSQDLVPKQTHEAEEAQQGESRKGTGFSLQLLLISSGASTHIDIPAYTRFTHDAQNTER